MQTAREQGENSLRARELETDSASRKKLCAGFAGRTEELSTICSTPWIGKSVWVRKFKFQSVSAKDLLGCPLLRCSYASKLSQALLHSQE